MIVVGPGFARRAIDVALSLIALLLLGPAIAVVALAIVITSGPPILFRQQRIGQGGAPFTMYKFRTMRNGSAGTDVTASDDARITKVGSLLRRTSFDEVPQLLNILRGQMTLVGPRPESLALAERYPAEARAVLTARPGLTGPSQVRLRDRNVIPAGVADVEEYYLREVVPARARLDLEYLRDPTIGSTLKVLLETAMHLAAPGRSFKPFRAPASALRSDRNGH